MADKFGKCHIERKFFTISKDKVKGSSRICISERNNQQYFELHLERELVVWIDDAIEDLLITPLNQKFYRQIRSNDGFLWFQRVTNKRGSVVEITRIYGNGKKSNIVVPAGVDCKGWRDFSTLIRNFFNGPPIKSKEKKTNFSQKNINVTYAEALKKNKELEAAKSGKLKAVASPPSDCALFDQIVEEKASDSHSDPSDSAFLISDLSEFNWDKTIIVTRQCFHDDWSLILKALREKIHIRCSLNPFQADKAILFCFKEEDLKSLILNKGWFSVGNFSLKFETWNFERHATSSVTPSYGGWVKLRNLPLEWWSSSTFKALGDSLGGFIQSSQITERKLDCMEVVIKVEENYCGFIPSELRVKGPDESEVRVQVVSFYDSRLLLTRRKSVHGGFSPAAAKRFDREEAEFCPMDRWRIFYSEYCPVVTLIMRGKLSCQQQEQSPATPPSSHVQQNNSKHSVGPRAKAQWKPILGQTQILKRESPTLVSSSNQKQIGPDSLQTQSVTKFKHSFPNSTGGFNETNVFYVERIEDSEDELSLIEKTSLLANCQEGDSEEEPMLEEKKTSLEVGHVETTLENFSSVSSPEQNGIVDCGTEKLQTEEILEDSLTSLFIISPSAVKKKSTVINEDIDNFVVIEDLAVNEDLDIIINSPFQLPPTQKNEGDEAGESESRFLEQILNSEETKDYLVHWRKLVSHLQNKGVEVSPTPVRCFSQISNKEVLENDLSPGNLPSTSSHPPSSLGLPLRC